MLKLKLKENKISYKKLTYLTNTEIKDKDVLVDYADEEYGVHLRIFDCDWIANNCNHSPATKEVIVNFASRHLREAHKPGREFIGLLDVLSGFAILSFPRKSSIMEQ